MVEASTSNFILEKFKFGELNPVGGGTRTLSDMSTPDSAMGAVRAMSVGTFQTDVFEGTGPYKGIVLRIDDPGVAGNPSQAGQAGTWFSNFTSNLADGAGSTQNATALAKVRVRIPEIHAALPIPNSFPDLTAESTDHAIIDMYPQFVAENTRVLAPTQAGEFSVGRLW